MSSLQVLFIISLTYNQLDYKMKEDDSQTMLYNNSSSMTSNGKEWKSLTPDQPVPKGDQRIGDFVFTISKENLLGKGGCGQVYRGTSISKEKFQAAIKIIRLKKQDEDQLRNCRRQIILQQLLKSEGIVKIYSSKMLQLGQQNVFVIAAELMDGELKVPKDGFKFGQAMEKLRQFLKCYSFLYKNGLAHRDLKPQNILVKEGKMKITDFGSAKEQTDKTKRRNLHTPNYASPQQRINSEHTDKCDVFALGCMLFQFFVGVPPAKAQCTINMNIMDFDKLHKRLIEKKVPAEIRNFIEECLRKEETVYITLKNGQKIEDPKKSRLSWQNVYLHPIFNGQFNHIPLEVAGSNILLTLKTLADSNDVKLTQILDKYQQLSSQTISSKELLNLLKKNKVDVQEEDLNRLLRMFGEKDSFTISQLLNQINKLDKKQFSRYKTYEALAFAKMFSVNLRQKQNINRNGYYQWVKGLKENKYKQRVKLQLQFVNFTAFPLLPPMNQLQQINIEYSQIQVLDVRLNAIQLNKLTMRYCQIERILTIRGCPDLTHLNLSGNQLREIEGLQLLPKLKSLQLKNNRLRKISNVGHLKQLQRLILNHNWIEVIEGLQGYPSLKCIQLQDNRLSELSFLLQLSSNKNINKINLRDNTVGDNQENKSYLQQFEEHFGGEVSLPKFVKLYELCLLEEGQYKIVPSSDTSKCIGDHRYKMALSEMGNPGQTWQFKQVEKEDYCLFCNQGKQIATGNIYRQEICYIEQYKKKQQNEDAQNRWVIEKRGGDEKGQQTYSIRNVQWKSRMYYNDNGDIVLPELDSNSKFKEWERQGRDLWYIIPA